MTHYSTTIIDPYLGDTDLNKREILYLLGPEENMLRACLPAREWIESLPDDVMGEWIWDNLPDSDWYCWIISELWEVEREDIREADPDWFDLANTIEERFSSLIAATLKTLEVSLFLERCGRANNARHKRLMDPYYEGMFKYGHDRSKYLDATEKYRTLHMRVSAKLQQRFDSSSEVKVTQVRYAKHVRNSDLLPDWAQVRKVLRHFYERESIHATEFWEDYHNG